MKKFKHDCDICEFLGHYEGYDLYFCAKRPGATVIARFDHGGGDYLSGLHSAKLRTFADLAPIPDEAMDPDDVALSAMRVAYLIARDKGLVG